MDRSRRFGNDEVSHIVRRALTRGGNDTISYDELEEIARHSGISADDLRAAIDEQETEGELDEAKATWIRRRRAKFYDHLRCYLIVNGVLFLINLMTASYLWVIWPILGWGMALAFDASDTFFVSEERLERGARRLLRRQARQRTGQNVVDSILTNVDEVLDSVFDRHS